MLNIALRHFRMLRREFKATTGIATSKAAQHDLYKLPDIASDETPQSGIAIVTVVKDEAPYLAEWLEFHLMLGARHIYIYDNGSMDDTSLILAPYIRDGIVTLIPWRNFSQSLNPQRLAFTHALPNFCSGFRWVAPIDVDEFLFPVEGDLLDATLAQLAHQPVVNLPWINYGPSGHQQKPQGLVIENYTERAAFPLLPEQHSLLRYKSIVDPRQVDIAGTHCFCLKELGWTMMNDRGETFPETRSRDTRYASAEKLRLHHYFTRSHEEIERKLKKGRVSKSGSVNLNALDARLKQYALAVEKDEAILRFAPELKARLAKRYADSPNPSAQDRSAKNNLHHIVSV